MRGLCTTLSIAAFALPSGVCAQGQTARERAFDSLLRELRSPDWSHTTDSLEISALRYSGSGVPLTAADSARALASFIAAARSSDGFTRLRVPYLALRIPLPEFAPLLEELADSPGDETDRENPDSDNEKMPADFVRDAAKDAYVALTSPWMAMTPLARLAALDRDVAASCFDASISLRAPCDSMRAALQRFRLHMSDSYAARAAVTAFQKALERAAKRGFPNLSVILLAGNDSLLEQSTFHVEVKPKVLSNLHDTIVMSYTVRVISPASDAMTEFIVDAPAYVQVSLPANGWGIGRLYNDRVAASWYRNSGKDFGAGQSTPALPLTSAGLLGFVQFLAVRAVPMSSFISDRFMDGVRADWLAGTDGARGFTVGVVPFPADTSPQALADRLASLIDRTCDLGWISDRRICSDLRAKAQPSSDSLRAFIASLDAQHRKLVSEAAYLLLTENARFLLARL